MGLSTYLRIHDRTLGAAWLAACVLGLGALAWLGVNPVVDRVIDAWNQRWVDRLELGKELFAAGEYERAADYLERLDADSPALLGKHRFGLARVRLLELLGRSQAELGRKRRALEALERLVAFDPRGWPGYYLLAETSNRLGEPGEAERAYRQVLEIHPNHLPSVEALIGLKYDSGLYAEVPPLYEAYLDAWLYALLAVRIGERKTVLGLSVDGFVHTVEAGLDPPAEPRAQVCLQTSGFSVELVELELVPPRRAGAAAWDEPLVLTAGPQWSAIDARPLPDGSFAADGPGAQLCSTAPLVEVGRVRLRVRAFKAVSPELWERVERSYRNVLDLEGLERARERTRLGGCALAGSELGTPDGELASWMTRCERLIAAGPEAGALGRLVAEAPDPFTAVPLLPKSMIVRYQYEQARREALQLLAELQAARGDEEAALAALEQLVALEPRDWRHRMLLAQAALDAGRDERAAEAYAAVLELRPDYMPALEALCTLLSGPERHERLASAVLACLEARSSARSPVSQPLPDSVWQAVEESFRTAGDQQGLERLRGLAEVGSSEGERAR